MRAWATVKTFILRWSIFVSSPESRLSFPEVFPLDPDPRDSASHNGAEKQIDRKQTRRLTNEQSRGQNVALQVQNESSTNKEK
jgi:hypothetical protein